MADNTTINAGTGGDVIASDDIAGVKHQRVKIEVGADGSATDVSGAFPLPIGGGTLATTTGSIPNATTSVPSASGLDVSAAGNITVSVSGTHAGVNLSFEASDDAGTTWFAMGAVREDSGIVEQTTGVLTANSARLWILGCAGINRFRVRSTAWTSGGTNIVRITLGTLPFEPTVAAIQQSPLRTNLALTTAAAGLTAGTSGTHALAVLANAFRGTTSLGTTGTSFALTAGKTFRVQTFAIGVRAAAATATSLIANLLYNSGGAVTTGSQIVAQLQCGAATAAIGSAGSAFLATGDGFDLPAGATPGQVGVSIIPTWTTTAAIVSLSLVGYEY